METVRGTINGEGGLSSNRMTQKNIEAWILIQLVSVQIVNSSPRLSHPEQQRRSEQREAASPGMRAWQPVAWKSESTQEPRVERWVPGYASAAGGGNGSGFGKTGCSDEKV